MRITYLEIPKDPEYSMTSRDYCCKDMQGTWESYSPSQLRGEEEKFRFSTSKAILRYGNLTVSFCPWCGAKIELIKEA